MAKFSVCIAAISDSDGFRDYLVVVDETTRRTVHTTAFDGTIGFCERHVDGYVRRSVDEDYYLQATCVDGLWRFGGGCVYAEHNAVLFAEIDDYIRTSRAKHCMITWIEDQASGRGYYVATFTDGGLYEIPEENAGRPGPILADTTTEGIADAIASALGMRLVEDEHDGQYISATMLQV